MPKRFSASSAAQLMACPGSAHLELSIPNWQEPVRDDAAGAKGIGTSVHAMLFPFASMEPDLIRSYSFMTRAFAAVHYRTRALIVSTDLEAAGWIHRFGGGVPGQVPRAQVQWLMELGAAGFEPRMMRFIADAADYTASLLESLRPGDRVLAEEPMQADWLATSPGTTPDLMIVGPDRLEALDYKSGAIPVSPVDNYQLMFYAACKVHEAPDAAEFTLHVVQPGNVDSWSAPIVHLHSWMELAREAEARIQAKDTTLSPSAACTFCPANPHSRGDKGAPFCPAMMQKLYPVFIDEEAIFQLD